MFPMDSERYFLIIKELNLYPEIKLNTINMLEQVMNAIILLSGNNIQAGIDKVLELDRFCQPFLKDSYIDVLEKMIPTLKELNIGIAQGEQVRAFYAKYNDNNKHYDEVGKQKPINLEFSLLKKLSYDGENIIWEETFASWVDSIMIERESKTNHQPNDRLINSRIFQKVYDLRREITHTILSETCKYTDEYRNQLTNSSTN